MTDPRQDRNDLPTENARPQDVSGRAEDNADACKWEEPKADAAVPEDSSQHRDGDAADPLVQLAANGARYTNFATIGSGGTGTVQSCLDTNLGRRVALKVLHPHLRGDPEQESRFVREARAMAQLEHPNIVPVHELGVREDGNLYFTMKQVRGVSLFDVLEGLKAREPSFVKRYPREYLMDLFGHVCQAVAFAHTRGFIHRDLKPQNVFIGDFGDVLLMDWGLVKDIKEHGRQPPLSGDTTAFVAARALSDTLDGRVAGTPRYMSPEQALGHVSELDARSDVYSLGAILYELLTLQYHVSGDTVQDVLEQVIGSTPKRPRRRTPHFRIPRELDAICMKCLSRNPAERYADARELAEDIDDFRRGLPVSACQDTRPLRFWKWCRRHAVYSSAIATAVTVLVLVGVGTAVSRTVRKHVFAKTADAYREQGDLIFARQMRLFSELDALRRARIVKEKAPREKFLEMQVERLHLLSENKYQTAMVLYFHASPGPSEARRNAYAAMFRNRLRFALASRDYQSAEQLLILVDDWIRERLERPPLKDRELLLDIRNTVKGNGHLTVRSRPPATSGQLFELVANADGVLAPAAEPLRRFDTTPVEAFAIRPGRYLLVLEASGRAPLRMPVLIDHGEDENLDVYLPRRVPEGTVYVPAGSFYMGGEHARYLRLHERDVAGFFISRTEVSFAEYLRFWLALDDADMRTACMGRVQLTHTDRRYQDAWDGAGRLIAPFTPELPVVGITRAAAEAYCAWLAKRLNRPCMLPSSEQWEKAARGVDARNFPWGDEYREGFAFVFENRRGHQRFGCFAPPGAFPFDRSVYGVVDMGGNVREWTRTVFPGSPFTEVKGASASTTRRFLYCSYSSDTPVVPTDVGFRYVLPLDEASD